MSYENDYINFSYDIALSRYTLSQMFLDEVNKCIHIFILGEDGTGCGLAAAAFAAVNLSIIFYQSATVYAAVRYEKDSIAWFMHQKSDFLYMRGYFAG